MDQSICTVDGCDRPLHVRKRGFCQYHYLLWWKNPDGELTLAPTEHACEVCSTPTSNPRYCSGPCRESVKWARRKASPQYEEQKARARAAYVPAVRVPKVKPEKPCTADDCERTAKARGLCTTHYRQEMKRLGLWKPSPADHWSNPRRLARATQRRAVLRGAIPAGEPFTIDELLERDGHTCGLCGEAIPTDTEWPDPMYATIDHIVPISRGGVHSLDNTQAAHYICNIRAGAKADALAKG